MSEENTKVCEASSTLIFSCSGAADVGEIADRAARQLTKDGDGKMFCLAGVGGRVDPIMEATRKATRRIALDGCPLDCVRRTLEMADVGDVVPLRVTDMGLDKGESPATDENVERVVSLTKAALR